MSSYHFTNPLYSQPKKVKLSPDKYPLIFVLTLEPFLKKIRSKPDIQGFTVADREHKVAAFADDLMLFLLLVQRPQISLPNLLQDLEQFENMSNLKINPVYDQLPTTIVHGEGRPLTVDADCLYVARPRKYHKNECFTPHTVFLTDATDPSTQNIFWPAGQNALKFHLELTKAQDSSASAKSS